MIDRWLEKNTYSVLFMMAPNDACGSMTWIIMEETMDNAKTVFPRTEEIIWKLESLLIQQQKRLRRTVGEEE